MRRARVRVRAPQRPAAVERRPPNRRAACVATMHCAAGSAESPERARARSDAGLPTGGPAVERLPRVARQPALLRGLEGPPPHRTVTAGCAGAGPREGPRAAPRCRRPDGPRAPRRTAPRVRRGARRPSRGPDPAQPEPEAAPAGPSAPALRRRRRAERGSRRAGGASPPRTPVTVPVDAGGLVWAAVPRWAAGPPRRAGSEMAAIIMSGTVTPGLSTVAARAPAPALA